jgi:hypothetical protein
MKLVSLGLLTAIINVAEKGKSYVNGLEPAAVRRFVDENFRDLLIALGSVLALEWVIVGLLSAR